MASSVTPSVLRRARREEVEALLVDGKGTLAIVRLISEKHGISTRQAHRDVSLILRRWKADDTRRADLRRKRTIRALERNAAESRAAGDLAGERDALAKVGRLLGMGIAQVHANVNIDARRQEVHVLALDARILETADLLLARLGEGDARGDGVRALEASVVPCEAPPAPLPPARNGSAAREYARDGLDAAAPREE